MIIYCKSDIVKKQLHHQCRSFVGESPPAQPVEHRVSLKPIENREPVVNRENPLNPENHAPVSGKPVFCCFGHRAHFQRIPGTGEIFLKKSVRKIWSCRKTAVILHPHFGNDPPLPAAGKFPEDFFGREFGHVRKRLYLCSPSASRLARRVSDFFDAGAAGRSLKCCSNEYVVQENKGQSCPRSDSETRGTQ